MAYKEELRNQRTGIIINVTSKKMEKDVIVELRERYSAFEFIRTFFVGERTFLSAQRTVLGGKKFFLPYSPLPIPYSPIKCYHNP